jgi:hypothetical protein
MRWEEKMRYDGMRGGGTLKQSSPVRDTRRAQKPEAARDGTSEGNKAFSNRECPGLWRSIKISEAKKSKTGFAHMPI